jgi:hypothetical protein
MTDSEEEDEEVYRPPPGWFQARAPFFQAMYKLRYGYMKKDLTSSLPSVLFLCFSYLEIFSSI